MSPADDAVGRAAVQAPPHGVGALVPRRDLFDVLGRARRVIQVLAPAGSGKTSLLRSWIAEAELRDSVAWVSVAVKERDPQRFWLAVLDAVRVTKAGSALVRELTPAPDLDGGAIVERLLADLSPLDEPIWLVIDDLHELCSDDAFRQLELLVMRAPAELRFVLLSRRELHLGLHRLRLEAQLTEIRAADLRFSLDESKALFESAGVQLSESAVALLAERTEGWAAGLRLAALSLAGDHDPERFAAAFVGSERTVAEYLVAEVLDRQPERVKRLLLRTSVLERVSGRLADVLTAEFDGQRVLQELEEAGAFVVSLDPARSWFRYHPLFADLLQLELRRTAADEVPALHRAAGKWFSEHGYPVEAIRHAQAAEEWTLACRLLSDNWFGLILSGQRATAHRLLAGFPLSAVAADAELSALRAAYELDRGSPEEAERYLALSNQADGRGATDRGGQVQLVLAIVRLSIARHRGDLPAVVEQAQWLLAPAEGTDAARPGLSDDLRAFALLEFGVAELWTGRFDAAERHLEQARAMAQRVERPFLELGALAHLAQIAIFESVPRGARRSEEAIELAQRHGWADDPVAGVAYAIHGIALVVQGRLAEAGSWLQQAERTRLAWVSPAGGLMLYVMRGLLEAASGDDAEALKAFRSAERLGELLVQPHVLAARIPGHLIRTLVRLGELERAAEVLAEIDYAERVLPEMRIAGAALRLARDDPEGATRVLAPLVQEPALAMRPRVWPVQALLLEAIARDALGDNDQAESALERSLDLAEPEGLLIPFLLYPAAGLLERHRRRRTSHAALISEILDLLAGRTPQRRRDTAHLLSGPLTESETRVLRYLPTNLSAPEIAGELYLSLNTIRTHMRHLYSKLGVHTRAEAVERARALGLLAPSSRPG
jgi:LuxR family transcriptional regulator, maltose regulon positive regulatory protein